MEATALIGSLLVLASAAVYYLGRRRDGGKRMRQEAQRRYAADVLNDQPD